MNKTTRCLVSRLLLLAIAGTAGTACFQDQRPPLTRLLVGEWAVTAFYLKELATASDPNLTLEGDGLTLCNSCPRVRFQVNNTGQVTDAQGLTRSFAWRERLHNGRPGIAVSQSGQFILNNGSYDVVVDSSAASVRIELKQQERTLFVLQQ